MALYMLFVVNKSGGLIYSRELSPVPLEKVDANELLTRASTIASLDVFAKQLAPVLSGGMRTVESPAVTLHIFETRTGVKFCVTARPRTGEAAAAFLRKVYEFYADYALKNPFYDMDMPIRIRLFDASIDRCVRDMGFATAAAK